MSALKRYPLVMLLLLLALTSSAQDSVKFSKKRANLLLIASSAAYTGSMVALNQTWYSQYDRQSFQFFNDSREWKQVDKVGHGFSAFQLAAGSSRLMHWAGINEKKTDRIACLTSFGIMASIEVMDGFSKGYGASTADLAANVMGLGLYWSQKAAWQEIRIHPKFSFWQTPYAGQRPSVLGSTLAEQILKDYNGQTYWLSVDMNKFIDRWPEWLNVAVGYGGSGMIYAQETQNKLAGFEPQRQFYLALDPNLKAIKSKSKVVNTIIYIFDMVKLPGPTVRFSGNNITGHFFNF